MMQRSFPFKVVYLFPVLLILAAILGLALSYSRGGLQSVLNSLIFIFPVLIAAGFLFLNKSNERILKAPGFVTRFSLSHLILVYLLLFIVSLILLISAPARSVLYLVIIALMAGVIFIQIINSRPKWSDYIIIAEIVCLSLNLIWGITLKYPLYFGYSDTLGHLFDIETILQSSHINNLDPTYVNFPLFAGFHALGVEITGLHMISSLFITMGIIWQAGIIFSFLIFRKLDINGSNQFSLLACLLFALSSQLIFYGSYTITRSMAFVFILCWLYLALHLKRRGNIFIVLMLLIAGAMILTHHVTVLFFVPLIFVVYLCQYFFVRNKSTIQGIHFLPIALLFICFFSYVGIIAYNFWLKYGSEWFGGFSHTNSPAITNTPVSNLVSSVSLQSLGYYSFILLFALTGIGVLLKYRNRTGKHLLLGGIAIAGLIFIPLFISALSSLLPFSKIALADRMSLIVSPFVILMMAYGVIVFLNSAGSPRLSRVYSVLIPSLVTVCIVAGTFFATICDGNASDVSGIIPATSSGSMYFTEAELASFSFVSTDTEQTAVFGDYESMRNLVGLGETAPKVILINGNLDSLTLFTIYNSYLILRAGELERRGALNFSTDFSNSSLYRYYLNPSAPTDNLITNLSLKDRVYSNGDVQIFCLRYGS